MLPQASWRDEQGHLLASDMMTQKNKTHDTTNIYIYIYKFSSSTPFIKECNADQTFLFDCQECIHGGLWALSSFWDHTDLLLSNFFHTS